MDVITTAGRRGLRARIFSSRQQRAYMLCTLITNLQRLGRALLAILSPIRWFSGLTLFRFAITVRACCYLQIHPLRERHGSKLAERIRSYAECLTEDYNSLTDYMY